MEKWLALPSWLCIRRLGPNVSRRDPATLRHATPTGGPGARLAPARQRLQRWLPHFDVQQAQRVQPRAPIRGDARVEAARPPRVREEHDGDRLRARV